MNFKKWETSSGGSLEMSEGSGFSVGATGGGYDFGDLESRMAYMASLKEAGREGESNHKYGTAHHMAGAWAESNVDTAKRDGDRYSESHAGARAGTGAGIDAQGYVSDKDAWLEGGKMGVGGSFDAWVGSKASAEASAKGGAGPAIGAIDPLTGERRGIAEGNASAGVEAFSGARVHGAGEAYVEGLSVGAAGKVGAELVDRVSGNASAGGSVDVGGYTLAGAQGSVDAQAEKRVGGDASGEVKLGLGTGGYARGAASAEAMGRVAGKAEGQTTLLGVHQRVGVGGSAEAGAAAGAQGALAFGPGSVGASGTVDAFAGARATVSGSNTTGFLGVDVFSSQISATAAAGVGGSAGGGIMIKDGILTINAELLLAAGVGGGVSGSFSVDFLSPFKMILRLLEVNGIISANPDAWISDIIGIAMGGGEAYKDRIVGKPGGDYDEKVESTKTVVGTKVTEASKKKSDEEKDTSEGSNTAESSSASSFAALGGTGRSQSTSLAAMGRAPVSAKTDGKSMSEDVATAKLGQAHGQAAEAAEMTKGAIVTAMESLKSGMANPVQVIRAILAGAAQAVRSMVGQGIQMAGALVKSVAGLAKSALSSFANIIARIVEAVLSLKKPDFSGGYAQQSGQMDTNFADALSRTRGDMDKMRDARLAGMKDAIQGALLAVATGFMQTTKGGAKPAQEKAKSAKRLVDEVAGASVVKDDGTVAKPNAKAKEDVGQVVDLLGQMDGAGQQSGAAIKGGAGGLASMGEKAGKGLGGKEKTELTQGMNKTYKVPKSKSDQAVASKQKEAEDKVAAARGKRRR